MRPPAKQAYSPSCSDLPNRPKGRLAGRQAVPFLENLPRWRTFTSRRWWSPAFISLPPLRIRRPPHRVCLFMQGRNSTWGSK